MCIQKMDLKSRSCIHKTYDIDYEAYHAQNTMMLFYYIKYYLCIMHTRIIHYKDHYYKLHGEYGSSGRVLV
jgi:hypothetical protein